MAKPTVRRLGDGLFVDYAAPLRIVIELGQFDHVDPGITEKNYEISQRGLFRIQPHIVSFDERFDSMGALNRALTDIGLESVDLRTLIQVDLVFPEESARGALPALASVRKKEGDQYLPFIVQVEGDRLLRETLLLPGGYWTEKAIVVAKMLS